MEKKIAQKLNLYMQLARLHRPVGIYLLFFPASFGILLAGHSKAFSHIDLYFLAIFFLGATLMRSAGCVINDIWDKNFDKQVERTKSRPLASNAVTNQEAYLLLFLLLLPCSFILFALNLFSIIIGLLALLMVITYPLMKRHIKNPQAFLGASFAIASLMGFVASVDNFQFSISACLTALLLYIACVCWVIGYDTIYGLQDKKGDEKLNLNSSTILWGNRITLYVFLCFHLFFGFYSLAVLFAFDVKPVVVYVSIVIAIIYFYSNFIKADFNNNADCQEFFESNFTIGLILFTGLLIQSIMLAI